MTDAEKDYKSELIIGRNAVLEALRGGRTVDTLLVAAGSRTGSVTAIIAKCREKGVVIKDVDKKKLDSLCGGENHQGVAAYAGVHQYAELSDIIKTAAEKGGDALIVICDEIEDPHNLGAIIRTAEACGACGIIIPKRRSVSLTGAVGKASAGAVEYMPVARVTNLGAAIDELKSNGFWIYGADMGGESWDKPDYSGKTALIIGSEGKGISRLLKEKCDFIVSLPMRGKINSLNASVAAGILMYEIIRKR
ncbi:MAG: 23S rRNA (guanosine(2251)-2'-O)-methyltransferase RlmB [Clostridiales bacterium]|nr:23S rRNA (guanosine(2251)-2'-O)-methyltransferase RlmB [Clostridiales bacterium]